MDIPSLIYQIARVFSYLSAGIEMAAVIMLLVWAIMGSAGERIPMARDLFQSGSRFRNTMILLLLFLFMIAGKGVYVAGMGPLVAISSICKRFASLSMCVFIASLALTLAAGIRGHGDGGLSGVCKSMRRNSMWQMILGYVLAYILYIP
ncbi:MAG: hypothetical protein SOV71_00945 [Anaerovoracaceae bacterium]|nr:hypothetical protein [Bacillota bacterium]MDY2670108.1 hypothetical protein [Anaerovoracaceae bacterium]